jgi:hypothetical protein
MSLMDDLNQQRDGLAVLRGLINLLTDPRATQQLLTRLEQAHEKAEQERAATQQLKGEQKQIRVQMADEAEAHRRALSDERLKLNNEINARKNEVAKLEAAVAQAKAEQDEAARQAVELRARWQRKIDAVDAGLRA